jgi:tetratricopeptide (TPR) repeat protein
VPVQPSDTFVGRARELAELAAALDDVIAGRGRVVLVGGEPGIGKSRLAEEVIAASRARRVRVLTGRCWEAGGAPAYWPWVQALRAYVSEGDPGEIAAHAARAGAPLVALLPEMRAHLPDRTLALEPDSEGARFRLMEAVAEFVRAAASTRPITFVFDDLHAADAPSLLLLRFIARELGRAPVGIVGCYRDTEVGPDLGEALAELSREQAVRRIELKGLGAADTARLLELLMGEGPAEELAAEVQAGTQGNPLFASEIARLLAAEGAAPAMRGRLPIPQGVSEAIVRRLQRQSAECREVLSAASVVGREFRPDVVASVSGLPADGVAAALDEAAGARLVGASPGASRRLRFSHILVRDALYDGLPVARRPELHRAVADALERLYATNPDAHLAEIAHHYVEAGSDSAAKALDYSERAGDRAASQHGYEEAVRHYRNALSMLGDDAAADPARTCELLISLGEVLSRAGDLAAANEALREGAALAEREGWPRQLARAALQYGGRFTWGRASSDPALVPALRRALAAVDEHDTENRVRLLGRLATALRDEPTRGARVRLAEEAVELAERDGDPATLGFALGAHWVAVESADNAADGLDIGRRVIELGEEVGDQERAFLGHDFRFNTFFKLADRAGVDVELEMLARLAGELRQPAQLWHVATGRAIVTVLEGRLGEAEEQIGEALELGRWAEGWTAAVSHRLALFVLRRAQGRLGEIEETMERSVHEFPVLLRFRCALAHTYAELGRERECRETFDAVMARDLRNEYVDAEWLVSMSLLADPCALLGDDQAAELLYALLAPYDRLYAHAPVEVSFGSMARVSGVLAKVIGRFDDAARHFESAMEVERRMRARPWLAHAQHEYGSMLLDQGDGDRAAALLDDALATYRELGMDSWAGRVQALTEPARTSR